MSAVAAARRGDLSGAARALGFSAPYEIAQDWVLKSRVAAISGNSERAITLLTSAADHDIECFAWMDGSAFRD